MRDKEVEIISLLREKKTQEKGLRRMMDTYQSRLYWHIRRLVVQHSVAQDILQETFIKAYQNILKFNHQSSLFTWLYRIATNEALQHIRKEKKMQKAEEGSAAALENLVANEILKDADEINILLEKAIQTLPEKQKLVFTMRYFDDLSYDDISKIVDLSVGTLKTNYHYAKQKIEDYIRNNMNL